MARPRLKHQKFAGPPNKASEQVAGFRNFHRKGDADEHEYEWISDEEMVGICPICGGRLPGYRASMVMNPTNKTKE